MGLLEFKTVNKVLLQNGIQTISNGNESGLSKTLDLYS